MSTKTINLEDYISQGKINNAQFKVIDNAIINRKNMLITGSAGLGKTTLLISIIQKIIDLGEEDKLLVPQVCQELRITAKGDGSRMVVDDLLYYRSDETNQFLKLLLTGKKGLIATIHADSPYRALEKITGNENISPATIANNIDLIVYFERNKGWHLIKIVSYNEATTEYILEYI